MHTFGAEEGLAGAFAGFAFGAFRPLVLVPRWVSAISCASTVSDVVSSGDFRFAAFAIVAILDQLDLELAATLRRG